MEIAGEAAVIGYEGDDRMKPSRQVTVTALAGLLVLLVPTFVLSQVKTSPAPAKSVTIRGVIETHNIDLRRFDVLDRTSGTRLTIQYTNRTDFVLQGKSVSSAAIVAGTESTVTYREELGDELPLPGGGRGKLVLRVATRVEVHAPSVPQAKAERRFTETVKGTVTDLKTNLMWQKGDSGKQLSWMEAGEYCTGLRLGAFSDWRLPDPNNRLDSDIVETLNLPKRSKTDIADFYWSTDAGSAIPFNYPASAVTLSNLYGFRDTARFYVRCVRATTP